MKTDFAMKKTRRKSFASHTPRSTLFLGIEGGATRTIAVLIDASNQVLKRTETGPCNLRLLKDTQILRLLRQLHSKIGATRISAVGLFLAGCRTPLDEKRMLNLLKSVWPQARHIVGNDTLSAFAAALGDRDGIILICGTGSNIRARHGNRIAHVGGWGHVGGDQGSGYWLGRETLRYIFHHYDETSSTNRLIQSVLRFLGFNTIEELVPWSLEANKNDVASITHALFRNQRYPFVQKILREAVTLLAGDVALAARKVGLQTPWVVLNRGLAKHQPHFKKLLTAAIRKRLPGARVSLSDTEGAVGAAYLATAPFRISDFGFRIGRQRARYVTHSTAHGKSSTPNPKCRMHEEKTLNFEPGTLNPEHETRNQKPETRNFLSSLTEQRNPRTLDLHRRSISHLVKTMLAEDSRTIPAIRTQIPPIVHAIKWIVNALQRGGRLFYIGAGTSGRLGVLDASECPPTFGSDPEMIQGLIAGGPQALVQSMESLEDDAVYGRQTVRDRGIGKKDVLVGITASGSTPFVLGALEEACRHGTKTIFLTFNPSSFFILHPSSFLKIAIPTGPEVLTGSTRLKAGTATKLVLNMFTTIAMIRLGKVRSNWMIALRPSSEKLRARAARIYSTLKKIPYEEAWDHLEKHSWKLC